jgi:hypothetical protein
MNATSRAILQTVLATDSSLSPGERRATQRLIDGQFEAPTDAETTVNAQLLVTQKRAAELLSVSRATVWRMTKDCLLHPVEIIPGTWRYPFREIIEIARMGVEATEHREENVA